MVEALPGEVVEAAVRVCGTAFYYKGQLKSAFVAAGVPESMYDRWAAEGSSKYVIARHVMADLASRGPSGREILVRVIIDLANMTKPDETALDQQAGRQAIAELRAVVTQRRLLVDAETADQARRRQEQARRVQRTSARQVTLATLSTRLSSLVSSTENPQKRGYELERLLADLFAAFELVYRPSYRQAREQIDGAFEYKSFAYLVEARWRVTQPDAGDLADFKMKVDGKLESTRGVFISMAGFNRDTVDYFMRAARGSRNNLLLVDGQDLTLILEGSISLLDALDYKIQAASQEGRWWAPVAFRS